MDSDDLTLPQLLERQVAETPHGVAVIFKNQQITYQELDQRANQVAHFLAAKGIGKGVPVGLLLQRSIDMVIAIWGLLKAGGTYVPLDTALPESRFSHIAKETGMPLLLTSRDLVSSLPSQVPAMTWEDAQPHIDGESTAAITSSAIRPEDVAYIAFTSGSTGKPKGVLIPHRALTRCHFWATEVFGFTRHDRFLLNFFRAPEELFYPHLIGATLVLSPPDAERDMRLLSEVVTKHQINVLGLTPSLLRAFLDEYPSGNGDPLKHVYCAGEALPLDFQQHFFRKSKANLYNFYGLAEAPYTSIWKCQPDDTRSTPPIGRPVDAKVLILNEKRNPVSGEAIGQLFIGGPGLALGYLNQPELTASKFLEHEGERLYCTGDQVYYDAEGQIIFLGRSDHQVQIRGLRVELGEIEAELRQIQGVLEAVVERRDEQLVSYLKLEPDTAIDVHAWREAMRLTLPDYMQPSAYVILTDMPRSTTGKTDRKALPNPQPQAVTDLRKPTLSAEDLHKLLVEWNDTEVANPTRCVHELFEDQAKRTPDAIAVIFEDKTLTFGQLNQQANWLAHELVKKGVGSNVLVAICVERSLELIIGLLGILKAGGAYVPLDADYPEERRTFMLEDCGTPVLVTTERLAKRYAQYNGELLLLDHDTVIAGPPSKDLKASVRPNDLAYVIYTSGSTGRPKGVEVVHSGIVRLVCNNDYCQFGSSRVFLQLAPATFDAATFEIWGALLHGARLIVAPPGREAMDRVPELIAEHGVSTAWLTSSLFNQIVDHDVSILSGLNELLIGGEALSPHHVARAITALPQTKIINGYGPTEATTFTTTHRIHRCEADSPIPIGRPISNTCVYILDEALQLVPIGTRGELHVSGPGLARGYRNRPKLTAERFREIKVGGISRRVYRTGDMCRWRTDGSLELLGRIDHQVKVRGFRIELGEIEALLATLPGVKNSAVLVGEGKPGDKQLVAYVILDSESPSSLATLKGALAKQLPDYMVPGIFTAMDAFPLNANGKLDRNALGDSQGRMLGTSSQALPAHTELERQLVGIWEELLPVAQVGTQDNFFDLGGHSLLATKLAQRIEDLLGHKLPIATLFQSPSVAQLARRLKDENWAPPWSSLVPLQPHGSKPPLFFCHGWGGTVFGFVELAKLFPKDQPCFGIQARGLDSKSDRDLSVEAMAAHYVEEIISFQPTGPIHLAGYSIGGMIAYEVAQQLHRKGRQVATLALVDSTPFGPIPWRYRALRTAFHLVDRFRFHVKTWSAIPAGKRLRYFPDRWRAIRQERKQVRRQPQPANAHAQNSEQPAKRAKFVDYYVAIATTYSPQPYAGTADLFFSKDANRGLRYFWRATIQGGVNFHELRGEHLQIIQSPELIKDLAETIVAVLHRNGS